MKKRTGTDQTLSKSLFSYIVYIYIPTPDFSSQATTQSVLHLPVYTMTIHLIQSLPLSPTVAPYQRAAGSVKLLPSFFNTVLSHAVKTVSSSALGDMWARSFFSCCAIGISKF